MIVVTGAAGQLGRLIVEALLERLPADAIGASCRDPGKAADLAARGVRVRHGDFADPATLGHAFEGATNLLLVSSNARATGGDTLAQHRAAIDAANAAGVRRIVYTSHMGASASSAFPPMLDHAETEAMLADSGVAWTALRNGFYAGSGVQLMGDALATGVIEAPADGKVAWTTHRDLAAGAAAVLLDETRTGPTPPLTGGQALDLADMAAIATDLGRPVRRMVVSDADQRTRMEAGGAPAGAIATVLGLYAAAGAGEFARVDGALAAMIGRTPTPMRTVIADKIAALDPAG